jgi:hypothetical protein
MVVKSNTWALAGTTRVSTITSAEQATIPIVRMAGFSFEVSLSDVRSVVWLSVNRARVIGRSRFEARRW